MSTFDVLAIDLGASNGRGIVGCLEKDKLIVKELYRFAHRAVALGGHQYWNYLSIYDNIMACINIAVQEADAGIRSIGIDSWAQDYGLLDAQDNLLGLVHTYRDTRTQGMSKKLLAKYTEQQLYSMSGVVCLDALTLLQLVSMLENERATIENAKTFLFIADLINFFLTGFKGCNATVASLGMMYDPYKKDWLWPVIHDMGLPDIFPPIVQPGTMIGRYRPEIAAGGAADIAICAVTSHDTLSALDFIRPRHNFVISSGTWSVAGYKIDVPDTSQSAYAGGFLSELGFDNQFYLLRNITGLWILQEVMREWEQEGCRTDYEALNEAALKSDYCGFIDVDRGEFALPGDMQNKISRYLQNTGQPQPECRADIYKCILLGLALKYRQVLDNAERISGEKFEAVNIVGGGAKNTALNTLTANLLGIPVLAGPYEAAAMGNILCQLIAQKEISGYGQACEILERSCDIKVFMPSFAELFQDIYGRYCMTIS